jgi:hypothetical protein
MANSAFDTARFTYLKVEFSYGDPVQTVRYTDWAQGVAPDWTATPSMEVKLPANTGGLDQEPAEILLPYDDFTGELSAGYRFAQTQVRIYQVFNNSNGTDEYTVYRGVVQQTTRNYQGRSNVVLVKVIGIKGRLNVPLGLVCLPQCAWTFTDDKTCKVFEPFRPLEVASISGRTITATPTPFQNHAEYYTKGYMEYQGTRVGIRKQTGTLTFDMVSVPPPSWLGVTVNAKAGCDKTITNCRTWANEARFGGFGYAIPSYHPLIEALS